MIDKIDLNLRCGKTFIPKYLHTPENIIELFRECAVMQIEYNWATDSMIYYFCYKNLPSISSGQMIPEYKITMYEVDGQFFRTHFTDMKGVTYE